MIWLALLAALLFIVALLVLRHARKVRHESGLPEGTIVYEDTGVEEAVREPLLSRRYGLVGRPDYLVHDAAAGEWIPVEVKSGRAPPAPYASHVLQLGAYCLLVEDRYGRRPSHGLLRYADATFTIPFTDALRYEVLDSADALRRGRSAPDVHRSHNEPARCAACGYRTHCGESLV